MSIETTLYSTLAGSSGVTDLVSTRIYPNPAPEDAAKPLISYMMVAGSRISTLPGVSDAVRKRIQINCHANTYSSAKAVAAAVVAALEGNGYLELEFDLYYDATTQTHTVAVDWSFMTA